MRVNRTQLARIVMLASGLPLALGCEGEFKQPMTLGGQQTSMANGSIFCEYLQSSAAGAQNASATLVPNTVSGVNGGQATFRP